MNEEILDIISKSVYNLGFKHHISKKVWKTATIETNYDGKRFKKYYFGHGFKDVITKGIKPSEFNGKYYFFIEIIEKAGLFEINYFPENVIAARTNINSIIKKEISKIVKEFIIKTKNGDSSYSFGEKAY